MHGHGGRYHGNAERVHGRKSQGCQFPAVGENSEGAK